MNDGVLSGAVFYPSYQLKLRRSEYYAMLTKVRECGAYTEWVEFFCDCLLASAEDAVRAMELLVNLRNKNASLINEEMGRSAGNGQRLLELIEGNPDCRCELRGRATRDFKDNCGEIGEVFLRPGHIGTA